MNLMTFIWIAHLHIQAIKQWILLYIILYDIEWHFYESQITQKQQKERLLALFKFFFFGYWQIRYVLFFSVVPCESIAAWQKMINNVYHQVDYRCWILVGCNEETVVVWAKGNRSFGIDLHMCTQYLIQHCKLWSNLVKFS